ncbi:MULTISPECIES: DUF418 domain-containing protein [unclassified Pseudonocardia]|uniref:DUF418 domain-containing protein n=1 Tax=unclassified Pseudonocardia TaxID=2619320 RepID=UPI0001FFDA88|nr:DUF418 domain-containing protein [Pseudonocardia sp. Ae707_Ps1]OLM21030.1 hypothetical protein Ae707Ps1_5289c [Pseudonocardia sp. Ae707_Ps1]
MSGDRLTAPDVLRGLAIAGTFATNVWVLADPAGPAGILTGTGVGWWPDDVLLAVANGKFLGLLTLLFGIGMELQYRSAVRRGLPWPGRYLARAGILFTEGLLHYVLVFEFDVLMGYAIASVLVAWLVGRSATVRIVAAALAGGFVVLVTGGLTAGALLARDGGELPPLPPYPATWTGQVWARLTEVWLFRIELVLIVPSAVVLFLAGSALLRAGVFDAGGTRVRRRLIAAGAAGVVLNVATTLAGADWFAVERYLVAPLVSAGLLGLVPEVLARLRGPAGRVRRGLTAVGRTAMTCYVGQNVVAGVLFHAWGAGLAGSLAAVPAPARTAAVVAVWATVVVSSAVAASWWLRRYERGPLETLTHALLTGRSPASRRGAPTP